MTGPGIGWFRTEGGAVIALDVPLTVQWAGQERRGELHRIPDADPVEPVEPEQSGRPKATAARATWAAFDLAGGGDPTGMSRDDIAARHNA